MSETANRWRGDQAAGLRRLFRAPLPQVVAFASGRAACGRTTLLVRTATALAAGGRGVLIIDENAGPGSAVSSFTSAARFDLMDALTSGRTLRQVTLRVAPSLKILPAARAVRELDHASRLAAAARQNLSACLEEMQADVAFILIDAALRRGGQLSPLALAARHMAVVVAAQSAAITQAYALIKRTAQERGRGDFQVAITQAKTAKEAQSIFGNMRRVAREHLDVRLDYLGASLAPATDDLAEVLLTRLPPAGDDGSESAFALPVLGLAVGAQIHRKAASAGTTTLDSVV